MRVVLVVILLCSACVPLVGADDVVCPCRLGYVCDEGANRCVVRDASVADASVADIGTRDAGEATDSGPRDAGAHDAGIDECALCAPDQSCLDGLCVRYVDLSSSYDATCAVLERGQVVCWGYCVSPVPKIVPGIEDAIRVEYGGGLFACALRRGGLVSCFSVPTFCSGTLGPAEPLVFSGPVRDLSTSPTHGCAILEDQSIQCWGMNSSGEFGVPTPTETTTPVAAGPRPALENPTDIEVGFASTCVVYGADSDRLVCFGGEAGGVSGPYETAPIRQLDALRDRSVLALTVDGILRVDLFAQTVETIARTADVLAISSRCLLDVPNDLVCHHSVGPGGYAALDNWGVASNDFAIAAGASEISVGSWYGCYTDAWGVVRCFGYNYDGRIGTGENPERVGRHDVVLTNTTTVAAGPQSACAIDAIGALICWGDNWGPYGHLGRFGGELTPRPVDLGGRRAIDVVLAGTSKPRAMAVLVATGTTTEVLWFGVSDLAGVAAQTSPLTPRSVASLAGAVIIAARSDELCGVRANGEVRCVSGSSTTTVPILAGASQLALGANGSFRLGLVRGRVRCSPRSGSCPSQLDVLDQVVEIAAGDDFGLARIADGTVFVFGDHPRFGSAVPAQLVGITAAKSLALYAEHACVVEAAGTTTCFGSNSNGRIDVVDRTPEFAASSPLVLGIPYRSVAAGDGFTCGVRQTDGEVVCWGRNDGCELGTCPGLLYETPVPIAAPVY